MIKVCTISNSFKKIFYCKLICSSHQSKFLHNFRCGFDKNDENCVLSQNQFRTYFTAISFMLFIEVSVSTEFQAFFSKFFFYGK